MLRIRLTFPGHRYHATPSGHHVNEGLVEWPPSPWRLCRALVAVGYAKLGWSEVPEPVHTLLEKLSVALPSYALPTASAAHSRHYMPLAKLDKGVETTTLVYDTFADVGDDALHLVWPVVLENGERQWLIELLNGLNYLGRSESWVEACIVEEEMPEANAIPCEPKSVPPGQDYEQVVVMTPSPAPDFDAWCTQTRAEIEAQLSPGRSAKAQKERAKALAPIPRSLVDALQWDTARWKNAGWAQAPGSRQVLYWRRRDALTVHPSPSHKTTKERPSVSCILLALATESRNRSPLLPVARTLPEAERVHRALTSRAAGGAKVDCPEITGQDESGRPLGGHQHMRVLPLDLDGDHHIDHVLLWATRGFGGRAREAARSLQRLSPNGRNHSQELQVAMVGGGELGQLRDLPEAFSGGIRRLLGPAGGATHWLSATPYVPPRFLKVRGKNSLEGQVRSELESLGFPQPEAVEVLEWRDAAQPGRLRLRHAVVRRAKGAQQPPRAEGFLLRLRFGQAVDGPICVGYGSHFGLGRFEAEI